MERTNLLVSLLENASPKCGVVTETWTVQMVAMNSIATKQQKLAQRFSFSARIYSVSPRCSDAISIWIVPIIPMKKTVPGFPANQDS